MTAPDRACPLHSPGDETPRSPLAPPKEGAAPCPPRFSRSEPPLTARVRIHEAFTQGSSTTFAVRCAAQRQWSIDNAPFPRRLRKASGPTAQRTTHEPRAEATDGRALSKNRCEPEAIRGGLLGRDRGSAANDPRTMGATAISNDCCAWRCCRAAVQVSLAPDEFSTPSHFPRCAERPLKTRTKPTIRPRSIAPTNGAQNPVLRTLDAPSTPNGREQLNAPLSAVHRPTFNQNTDLKAPFHTHTQIYVASHATHAAVGGPPKLAPAS